MLLLVQRLKYIPSHSLRMRSSLSATQLRRRVFKFPKPAVVQVGNQAAIAFAKQADTGGRSKLRHIDLRQHWVHLLRESGLVTCVHVSTVSNLADMLTKALDTSTFKRLRDQLMYWCPL